MKFISKKVLLFLFVLMLLEARAASVDTVTTTSPSMHKNIKAVVIKPDTYVSGKSYPVVYLLHGFGDNYTGWITKVTAIAQYADQYQLIIVCPDGNFASWYLDSPVDTSLKYETYISKELVSWIDKNYKTINKPKGRAITGLSMGGHGGIVPGI